MHLILLERLEEKFGLWKAFKVGVELEIRGGEARTLNEDEFMFGYKVKKKREREIFKDDQRKAPSSTRRREDGD